MSKQTQSTLRLMTFALIASLFLNFVQYSQNAGSFSAGPHSCKEDIRIAVAKATKQKCPPSSIDHRAVAAEGGEPDAKNTDGEGDGHDKETTDHHNTAKDGHNEGHGGDHGGDEAETAAKDDPITAGGLGRVDDEEGYVFGLEKKAVRTPNTVYNPDDDKALMVRTEKEGKARRYGRSAVPKGSWKVRVGPNKWVTMDEVAFAYDVWFNENQRFQYMSWMGVFVQQDPTDAFAIQDMLWRVKPDLVIEIGTNTGGGAIFYSTIMKAYNPDGKIVTLDVKPVSNWNKQNDNRCVGCVLATKHKWWGDGMIQFIQGRVTEAATAAKVQKYVDDAKTVLVIEDASHRYPDTLENIEASYKWVTPGSYLLVQDTKMDRFVAGLGVKYGRYKFGPMRSVDEFVARHKDFVIDRRFEYLLYSQHHRGWLRRKKKGGTQ